MMLNNLISKLESSQRPTVGLALGSGGMKGGAHIGVIRALVKNNIPIDYITGTSVGSIIGATYALYKDLNILNEMLRDLLSMSVQKHILLDLNVKGGISKGENLEAFLEKYFKGATIDSCKIPFVAVGTNFENGHKVILNKGRLARVARMSSCIPGVFKPVYFDNMPIVDGGLVEQVPALTCRNMGADIVIASSLNHAFVMELEQSKNGINDLKYIDNIGRTIKALILTISNHDIKNADFVISPPINGGPIVDKDRNFLLDVKLGYKEALKIIPEIKHALKG